MAEWNLKTEKLTIFIEKDEKLEKIKTLSFRLNEESKQKLFNKKTIFCPKILTHFYFAYNSYTTPL
jgi:hypothetical protein